MAKVITTITKEDPNGNVFFSAVGGSQNYKTLWDAIGAVEWIERNSVDGIFEIVTSVFENQRMLTYLVEYENGKRDIISYLIV